MQQTFYVQEGSSVIIETDFVICIPTSSNKRCLEMSQCMKKPTITCATSKDSDQPAHLRSLI